MNPTEFAQKIDLLLKVPDVRCGKIPSVGGGNLVHLEVPASSSSGISFPVPLGGPSSNAVSRAV